MSDAVRHRQPDHRAVLAPAGGCVLGRPDAVWREGEKITLTGAVLDGDGKPCADACVEMWQSDPTASDSFPGFGRSNTDSAGIYRFTTVKPGAGGGARQCAAGAAYRVCASCRAG